MKLFFIIPCKFAVGIPRLLPRKYPFITLKKLPKIKYI